MSGKTRKAGKKVGPFWSSEMSKAFPYLVGTSLFYALLIVIQKMGLNDGLEPMSFSFSRSIFVVLISLAFFAPLTREIKNIKSSDGRNLLILGAVSAASILILFFGQGITSAMNAGFLTRLTPLFVLPIAYILLRERASSSSMVYMLLMLAGAFLLITSGDIMCLYMGDMLIISATMLIAFQNVLAKRIMRTVSLDMVIFIRACLSSLLIVAVIPFLWVDWSILLSAKGLLYSVIAAALYFLSVISQYKSISLIGPFTTTAFFLTGSLFSALLAYILLGETLSAVQWLGVAGILAGGFCLISEHR